MAASFAVALTNLKFAETPHVEVQSCVYGGDAGAFPGFARVTASHGVEGDIYLGLLRLAAYLDNGVVH